MKHAHLRLSGKKFVSAAILSASLFLLSPAGKAANHATNIEILSGNKTNIQFAGSSDDALLFKVYVLNDKGDEFTLTIKNASGDVLFSKSFKDSSFQKQFKVLTGGQDSEKYYFSINSKNRDICESYAISASTHSVADVVINKL